MNRLTSLSIFRTIPYLQFIKDRFIQISNGVTLAILLLATWLLYSKSASLPHEIPFWYTLPTANLLAPSSYLWRVIALSIFLWLLNLVFSLASYRTYPTLSRILSYIAMLVAILTIIGIGKTILIYFPLI
jgi:hypothetical protein